MAPRDYLSTFVKLGTISRLLAIGILVMHPTLHVPALTRFIDGTGPVFAGKIFPFAFITIACGAISGFHSLISSGATPKLIASRATEIPMVGYGAMMAEAAVAVMAVIAACVLQPGVYFAVNSPAGIVGQTAEAAAATISKWGFFHHRRRHAGSCPSGWRTDAIQSHGRRPGFRPRHGAHFRKAWVDRPSRPRGILRRHVRGAFHSDHPGCWNARRTVHDPRCFGSHLQAARPDKLVSVDSCNHALSLMAGMGFFLLEGVEDPLGGINSSWPLFGIANQLLATVALCVATTIIIKMHRARYAAVTLVLLIWLVAVTFTASWHKIFDADPRVGFLAQVRLLAASPLTKSSTRFIFNNRLDAAVTGALVEALTVALVLIEPARHWWGILNGRDEAQVKETPFVMTRLAGERP